MHKQWPVAVGRIGNDISDTSFSIARGSDSALTRSVTSRVYFHFYFMAAIQAIQHFEQCDMWYPGTKPTAL
jgi:hypothetical protein